MEGDSERASRAAIGFELYVRAPPKQTDNIQQQQKTFVESKRKQGSGGMVFNRHPLLTGLAFRLSCTNETYKNVQPHA